MTSTDAAISKSMVGADAVSSVFQAIAGLRNVRALIAAAVCGVAAVLLAGVIGALLYQSGAVGTAAFLTLLILFVLLTTGFNAQGILLMDQAQGLSPRRVMDAIVFGLLCIPKQIVLAIGLFVAALGAVLVVALALLVCKIPVAGQVLFAVVFPVGVLLIGAALLGLIMCMFYMSPAVWSGAGIMQAFAQLLSIVARRLVEAVILFNLSQVLCLIFVVPIVGSILLLGFFPTTAMSVGIVGAGGGDLSSALGGLGGDFGGFGGLNRYRGGGGLELFAITGLIGTGLLWVGAVVVVFQVFLMAISISYLRITEGMDTRATEKAISAGVAEAKKRAVEMGDRARQAAERAREQAEAAARAAAATRAAQKAEQPAAPSASSQAVQLKCVSCGQPLLATDRFCGNCGASQG